MEKVDLGESYKSEAQDDEDDEDFKAKDGGDVGSREPSKRKRGAPPDEAEEPEPAAKKSKAEE